MKDSLKLEELRDLAQNGRLEDALIPLDQMFSELQSVVPAEKYIPKAYNGNDFFRNQYRKLENSAPVKRSEYMMQKGHFITEFTGIWKTKNVPPCKMFLDPEELR